MGLTSALAELAAKTAHVLVVETPGSWGLRVSLERALADRGWVLAGSPADADVLAVCGRPGPELGEAVARLWDQLPGPRVRVDVEVAEAIPDLLAQAAAELADLGGQQADARSRGAAPAPSETGGHGGHGDHDEHGDHDMEMAPGGIPLAGGRQDRDGLEMDALNVRLGPVLRHWPAGLALRCTLHGDVVSGAEASLVDHDHPLDAIASTDAERSARRCDAVADLLALAGWQDASAQARRVRDLFLVGRDPIRALNERDLLRRRIGRSRLLRWSLHGLRPIGSGDIARLGLPDRVRGDVHDRLLRIIDSAAAPETVDPAEQEALLAALPDLVTGLDVAAARLVVASLDLEPSVVRREARHD